MNQHDDLIQALSEDLRPVKPVTSPERTAVIWLICSLVYVMLVTAFIGPLRPGAFVQLITVPRFFAEMALGLVALVLIALMAFRASVPGRMDRRFFMLGTGVLLVWLLQYLPGLWFPALEPSMAGKREACWVETLLYAPGPMLAGFYLTRRLYPLNPWQVTVCFSLVSGLLPAWYMQLACMYVMPHVLDHHILPGLVIGLAGSGLALLYRGDRKPDVATRR